MFTNLHSLPAGKALFTVALTDQPTGTPDEELCYDELDLVAPRRASLSRLVDFAQKAAASTYGDDVRIVGILNQSTGEVLAEAPQGNLIPEGFCGTPCHPSAPHTKLLSCIAFQES